MFWTVIVLSFGILVWIIMFIVKRCVTNPKGKKAHQQMEEVLKQTDFIGEGEMVLGGLFTFAILVLIIFAYTFSNSYLYRYPIEEISGGASFACDETLSNAQFSSGLMALAIPPNDNEIPMFTMLDDQAFTLYIYFINTLFKCEDITVTQVKDIDLPMQMSSCNVNGSSVFFSLSQLPHTVSLQVSLADTNTIGGIRIGLEGPGLETENDTLESAYTLANLSFAQTLSASGSVLTQQPSFTLQLTKVINRTYSLEAEGVTEFSGIWLPIISGNSDQMFVDASEYKYGTSSNTILSIVFSETSSYMLNTQRPIADQDEIIFTDLLFTILCLEIFGLGFLIFKLIIFPIFKGILGYCRRETPPEKSGTDDIELE
jgi:hypothetical protein